MDSSEIKKRYGQLKSQRKTVEQTWQQVEQLVVPFRGKFFRDQTSEHEIEWRQVQLYDTTAPLACDSLSAAMQGSLTSPAMKWFGLRFQTDALNNDVVARAWLESCSDIVFNTLQDSNFNIEASEFYLDLTSFGTAMVGEEPTSEDSWEGVAFQAVPCREGFFESDSKEQVYRFYRRIQWTPVQLIDKFGKDNVPQHIIEKATASASMDTKQEVIFCIYPRDKYRDADTSATLAPLVRPYGWKYILEADGEQLGDEGGYYEMPMFVARWRKVSGSQWGHSPAMICMPDILNINELVEATLEAAGKVIDPAVITTNRGLLGDVDLGRGGQTVVKNIGDIAPFDPGARFDVSQAIYELFQNSIRQTFRVDQLQLKESPAMTATEVQVRYELMQRLLGPTLGRLENDFLDPLVTRTFNILFRMGQLPEMPPQVQDAEGQYKIEYTGPLPRAQRMDEVRSMQEWLMTLGQAAEVMPEVLDNIDPDAFAREAGNLMSVPASIIRPMDSSEDRVGVNEIREQRAAQQRQALEAAQAQAEGEAMQAQGKGAQELQIAESQTATAA